MSGVVIEHELGVRQATRQVDRIAARHRLVLIAIRHQDRVVNTRQIGGRLTPPGMNRLQLGDESDESRLRR